MHDEGDNRGALTLDMLLAAARGSNEPAGDVAVAPSAPQADPLDDPLEALRSLGVVPDREEAPSSSEGSRGEGAAPREQKPGFDLAAALGYASPEPAEGDLEAGLPSAEEPEPEEEPVTEEGLEFTLGKEPEAALTQEPATEKAPELAPTEEPAAEEEPEPVLAEEPSAVEGPELAPAEEFEPASSEGPDPEVSPAPSGQVDAAFPEEPGGSTERDLPSGPKGLPSSAGVESPPSRKLTGFSAGPAHAYGPKPVSVPESQPADLEPEPALRSGPVVGVDSEGGAQEEEGLFGSFEPLEPLESFAPLEPLEDFDSPETFEPLPAPDAGCASAIPAVSKDARVRVEKPRTRTRPRRPGREAAVRRRRLMRAAIVLAVLGLLAAAAAFWSFTQAQTMMQDDSRPIAAEQAEYRYRFELGDEECQVVERASYDAEGMLMRSEIEAVLPSAQQAEEFAVQARAEFGDDALSCETEGSTVLLVVDLQGERVDRGAYEALLSDNVLSFEKGRE